MKYIKLLLSAVTLIIINQKKLPASTTQNTISYNVSSWSWSRKTRGYYKLAGVRKVTESYIKGKLSQKKTGIKGGQVYRIEKYIYDKGILKTVNVYNGKDKLLYIKSFNKNKAGKVEIIKDPAGKTLWFSQLKISKDGMLLSKNEYSADKKLRQIYKYSYNEKGFPIGRIVFDKDESPLHLQSYDYQKIDQQGRWLLRNETQSYADVYSSPKEWISRSLVNYKDIMAAGINPGTEMSYPPFTMETYFNLNKMLSAGSTPGNKVLGTAFKHIKAKTIIKGSCYDWINMIYKECGFTGKKRKQYFLRKKGGAYLNPLELKPGDWIMFKNQSYGDSSHSGIFLHWIDFDSRSALVIGYVGQKRTMPGRYREYDITRTFGVIRGQ